MPGPRHRTHASRLVLAGLAALAVAIGVGAVIALHARHHAPVRPPAGRQEVPSASRGLVGILGVLRRPQTAADRAAIPAALQIVHTFRSGVATPVRSLVRVAGVSPEGAQIVLVPLRLANGGGLQLGVVGDGASCCDTPAEIADAGAWGSSGSVSGNDVTMVVPDGVGRVSVAFAYPVSAAVHDNVATFSVPTPVENLSTYPMTWFGRSGQVVTRFASSLGEQSGARPAAARRARLLREVRNADVKVSPQLQHDFALFRAEAPMGTFGSGQERFTLRHPPLGELPTFVLSSGYPMALTEARLLTTPGGLRLWLVARRTICAFGPSSQNEVCTGSAGRTGRFGLIVRRALADGRVRLIAMVPSTNRSITVATAAGRTAVPLHDGVTVMPGNGITSVTFKNGAGASVTRSLWLAPARRPRRGAARVNQYGQ